MLKSLRNISIVIATHDWDIVSKHFQNIWAIDKSNQFIQTNVENIISNKELGNIFELPDGIIQERDSFSIQ